MLRLAIISDSTGETAETMARVTMKQFQQHELLPMRYKNIRTKEQVDAIFSESMEGHDLIIYTIVDKDLREYIAKLSRNKHIRALDLLGSVITSFSNIFDTEPQNEPGLVHQVNKQYFERVSAIEFTLNHDDGKNIESLYLCDIILLGISRTSKTPLSIYLSLHGIKVINIPLIYGVTPPEELKKIDPRKIFGLTIDSDALYNIRKNRLNKLGVQEKQGTYASLQEVIKEVDWANELFSKNKKWSIFNVTNKALEETAAEIRQLLYMRENNPFKKGAKK